MMTRRSGIETFEIVLGSVMISVVLLMIAAVSAIVISEMRTTRTYTIDSTGVSRETLLIEGCEYVRIGDGGAHKGNCKACLQRFGLKAEKETR